MHTVLENSNKSSNGIQGGPVCSAIVCHDDDPGKNCRVEI